MKISTSLVLIVVLSIASLLIVGNPTQIEEPGNAVTANFVPPTQVVAGDTYYYNISNFPSWNDLLGIDPATENVSVSGSFEGSQIYVKVLDTNLENMSYWNGAQQVVADLPTFDLSVGIITSSDMNLDGLVDDEAFSFSIPSGIAIPVPTIFGTSTYFNVTQELKGAFLPLPLVLSNDFDLHELILTQFASQVGGSLAVQNDASQFSVSMSGLEMDTNATIVADGLVSYSKPSGLLQELNVKVTNTTSGETMFDMDVDLIRQEYHPLPLVVGDTFELSVIDAGFDYTLTGFDPTDNIHQDFANAQGNMTNSIGDVLVEFRVMEIDGLYYRVEGTTLNENGTRTAFPENDGLRDDLWFSGFGRPGVFANIPSSDPARTFVEEEIYNPTTGYYEDIVTDERIPIRARAMPGPVITADYEIYQAWDNTASFLTGLFSTQLTQALNVVDNRYDDFSIRGSTGPDAVVDLEYSHSLVGSDYSWRLAGLLDINVWTNSSSEEWNGTTYVPVELFTDVTILADGSLTVDFVDESLQGVSLVGESITTITEYNSTFTETTTIHVSNLRLQLAGHLETSYVPPISTETSSQLDTTTTQIVTVTSSGSTNSDPNSQSSSDDTRTDTGEPSSTIDSETDPSETDPNGSDTTTTSSDDTSRSDTSETSEVKETSDPVDTSDNSGNDTGIESPQVELPGLEFGASIFGLLSVIGISVLRRRK